MVAAELLADAGERVAGDLATKIHRNLPAERDPLSPPLRFEIGQANVERIRNHLLNGLYVGLDFVSRKEVFQKLGARTRW